MTWLTNFWVQKRYRTQVADNKWMCFVWGMAQTSMLNALEEAARKSHTKLNITQHSDKHWTAVDPETDTRYIVEMRNDQPTIEGDFSVRDQTIPWERKERKQMPVAGSLFQGDLFKK